MKRIKGHLARPLRSLLQTGHPCFRRSPQCHSASSSLFYLRFVMMPVQEQSDMCAASGSVPSTVEQRNKCSIMFSSSSQANPCWPCRRVYIVAPSLTIMCNGTHGCYRDTGSHVSLGGASRSQVIVAFCRGRREEILFQHDPVQGDAPTSPQKVWLKADAVTCDNAAPFFNQVVDRRSSCPSGSGH